MSAIKPPVLDRRHGRLRIVIVIVGTLAALGPARASLASGSHTGEAKTLHYDVTFVRDSQIDLGAHGPSVGDERTFYDVLFDRNGRRVGYEGGVCAVESMSPPVFSCSITFSLPHGQLATQLLNEPRTGAKTLRHHRRLG
jgi:lactam utilization protein B